MKNQIATKYDALARTAKKIIGVDAKSAALDAVVLAEVIVCGVLPGDAQKALAKSKDESYTANQSFISALGEAVVGLGVTAAGAPDLGLAMAAEGVVRGYTLLFLDKSPQYKNTPVGSLVLEVPYRAVKGFYTGVKKARDYFADVYKEAELELAEERSSYKTVGVVSG